MPSQREKTRKAPPLPYSLDFFSVERGGLEVSEFSKQFVVCQNGDASVLFEVSEVFVATDDIVHGNTLGQRKKIEILRVADVGLGLYGNVGEEADVVNHLKEIIASLCRDELVELLASYDAANFIEFLLADVNFHVVAAQHIGQRREPLAYHERNPQVGVEQNLHPP